MFFNRPVTTRVGIVYVQVSCHSQKRLSKSLLSFQSIFLFFHLPCKLASLSLHGLCILSVGWCWCSVSLLAKLLCLDKIWSHSRRTQYLAMPLAFPARAYMYIATYTPWFTWSCLKPARTMRNRQDSRWGKSGFRTELYSNTWQSCTDRQDQAWYG